MISHRRSTCPAKNCMYREDSPASRCVHVKEVHEKTWSDAVKMINDQIPENGKKLTLSLARKRKYRPRKQNCTGRPNFFGPEEEHVISEFMNYQSERKMAPRYSDIANALNYAKIKGKTAFNDIGNRVYVERFNSNNVRGFIRRNPHKFNVKAPRVQEFKRVKDVQPSEVKRYIYNLIESVHGWGSSLQPFQIINFDEVGIGGKEESSRAPEKIVVMVDENGNQTTGDLFLNERSTPRVTFVPFVAASGMNVAYL